MSLRALAEQQELPSGIVTLCSKEETTNRGKLELSSPFTLCRDPAAGTDQEKVA